MFQSYHTLKPTSLLNFLKIIPQINHLQSPFWQFPLPSSVRLLCYHSTCQFVPILVAHCISFQVVSLLLILMLSTSSDWHSNLLAWTPLYIKATVSELGLPQRLPVMDILKMLSKKWVVGIPMQSVATSGLPVSHPNSSVVYPKLTQSMSAFGCGKLFLLYFLQTLSWSAFGCMFNFFPHLHCLVQILFHGFFFIPFTISFNKVFPTNSWSLYNPSFQSWRSAFGCFIIILPQQATPLSIIIYISVTIQHCVCLLIYFVIPLYFLTCTYSRQQFGWLVCGIIFTPPF